MPRQPRMRPGPQPLTGTLTGLLAGLLLACTTPGALAQATAAAATVQVQEGDMASVLAFRLKPRGATTEQMMAALLRLNPEAFIQGNVNLLRDGALLRLPQPQEVLGLPPEEARALVRQHEQSLSSSPGPAANQTAAILAKPPTAVQENASQPAPAVPDREALLERLRSAKVRLAELEESIQALERLTHSEEAAAPASPARPQPETVPLSWIWLGVAAIVAFMVGMASSRRRGAATGAVSPAPTTADGEAAKAFHARLGSLDLNLDKPSPATSRQGHAE